MSDVPTEAQMREIYERVKNWGRWGADDERGALNLITPEKRREVHRLLEDLGLVAEIADPVIGELVDGGTKLGDPPAEAEKRHAATDRRRAPRRVEQREPSLYVANLPWATTPEDLLDTFGKHGRVFEATIITDRRTGRPRGFGFVQMPSDDAKRAIDALHGTMIGGREITVRFADRKPGKGRR